MNTEDFNLDQQQRQRVEQIERELADLDRREEQLLEELSRVLEEAPRAEAT